ncbi:MAG: tRNA1(Val) (adenine(37)-N6)-methyltransferase [Candidatus Binatia bacterium]
MNKWLKNKRDETLDTLFRGKLVVIQAKRGYRFSLDAVLLAHFVEIKGKERIMDLGSGSGVIALILAAQNPSVQVVGLEVQERMVDRAMRSVALNHLNGRVEIVRGDVRSFRKNFTPQKFDLAVANPPYRRLKSGRVNPDPERYVARHEIEASLPDFLNGGSYLLRRGGRITLVYPAARATDLITAMRQADLEPSRLRFVHSFQDAPASLVLAEGIKGSRSELEIMQPLVVYAKRKQYTDEMNAIFAG